jgi:fructokinase
MRIALAGEALIDFTGTGPLAFQGHEGGAVMNSAIACARLGQPTAFITQLSNDLFGEVLMAYIQANGVDTRFVLRSPAPSTLAFVERTPTTNRYAFYMQGTADVLWSPPSLPELPESCRYLQFGSIALLQDPAGGRITELVEASRGQRVIVFDPNMRPSLLKDADDYRKRYVRWLRASDVLKLSDEDAALLSPGMGLADAAASYLKGGPQAVIITRGGEGATLYREGKAPMDVTPPKITVADTIGAGDTFTAGLSVSLLEHGIEQPSQIAALGEQAWAEVLKFAATAAALNCTREGADPPTREELRAMLGA